MLSTKRFCFRPVVELRGYPAAEDLETLDGVGEVDVVAVAIFHHDSISYTKSCSRA